MDILCLEGTQGSGKKHLAWCLARYHEYTLALYEPQVADMIDLQLDGERWAFYTQLRILLDRMKHLNSMSSNRKYVTVGSPKSDVQCHAAIICMPVVEMDLYKKWANRLQKDTPSHRHILVRSPTPTLFAAIIHAARREQAHITTSHIQTSVNVYNKVFEGFPSVTMQPYTVDNEVMLQETAEQLRNLQ